MRGKCDENKKLDFIIDPIIIGIIIRELMYQTIDLYIFHIFYTMGESCPNYHFSNGNMTVV